MSFNFKSKLFKRIATYSSITCVMGVAVGGIVYSTIEENNGLKINWNASTSKQVEEIYDEKKEKWYFAAGEFDGKLSANQDVNWFIDQPMDGQVYIENGLVKWQDFPEAYYWDYYSFNVIPVSQVDSTMYVALTFTLFLKAVPDYDNSWVIYDDPEYSYDQYNYVAWGRQEGINLTGTTIQIPLTDDQFENLNDSIDFTYNLFIFGLVYQSASDTKYLDFHFATDSEHSDFFEQNVDFTLTRHMSITGEKYAELRFCPKISAYQFFNSDELRPADDEFEFKDIPINSKIEFSFNIKDSSGESHKIVNNSWNPILFKFNFRINE